MGVTYSVQQISIDQPGAFQEDTSIEPSQATSLVLEPRFFPSRSRAPCDTIPHDYSVDRYNGEMRRRYLGCYTPDVSNLLSHMIQTAIFGNAEDYVSGLITTADPAAPLTRMQADTCRAITSAFTDIMTQVMNEEYGPDEHPAVSFVDPSKWGERLNEIDPDEYIRGLGKSVGGKGKSHTILSEAMGGAPLSHQTKLKVYLKDADQLLWPIVPDGRELRRGARTSASARTTFSEADEDADFDNMPEGDLYNVLDAFYASPGAA